MPLGSDQEMNSKTLYQKWMEAWNGNLDLIDEIISPDFVFHPTHAQPGQPDFNGQAGMRKMIEMSRQPFSDINFTVEIGPIAEGDLVVARWRGKGAYAGGMPGATAPEGTAVDFSAIDILRVRDGKFTEYWHNADDLNFMLQVGAVGFVQKES